MKLRTLCFFLIMLLPITALAQFTQVSATVTDPNGLAYSNGTVVAKLVLPGGTSPTLNGLAYTPPSQPVGLNSVGFFLMQLADNNVLLPAATQWSFTVCSAAGTIQPAGGRGPVCFNAGPITITGGSQSITATLNAAALALSLSSSGTTINPTNNALPKRTSATTFGDSAWIDNGTTMAGSETVTTTGELQSNQATNTGTLRLGSDGNVFLFRNASSTITLNGSLTLNNDTTLASAARFIAQGISVTIFETNPTIAAAGCGGGAATITPGGSTAAFAINVGTTPGSACTITMPAATNTWDCSANDITTNSSSVFLQKQTGAVSTTSVTITNFNTAAAATAFVASDVVNVKCTGR